MIRYKSDLFGLRTLLFWNGSAAFRAFLPALFSTGLLLVYEYSLGDEYGGRNVIVHPYVITVFITFFSFLLTIRLNYSYQRYWEAATQVHQMSSKWMDSAICLASFHYQCQQYDSSRPPTFGRTPNIFNETRERERHQSQTLEDTQSLIRQVSDRQKQQGHWLWRYITPKPKETKAKTPKGRPTLVKTFKPNRTSSEQSQYLFQPPATRLHSSERQQQPSAWKEWRAAFAAQKGKEGTKRVLKLAGLETTVPSLFLQEAAHLFSLLSAVAMATMRNDIEGAESPLADYIPGRPFPPVNPDELSQDIKRQYHESNSWLKFFYFMIGKSRSSKQRTLYNAARPFRVIGGISDKEARMLQEARGPSARMALCSIWLKEFISREYLNGSTGNVAPPIISRVYQFISEGMSGYNQARKVAYIPFPFPHAQITTLFVLVIVGFIPVLMLTFLADPVFGFILNLITVMCFTGLHEVARELENPFQNVPNDIPLNNFQAQFNEALMVMFFGYHPDAYWQARPVGSYPLEPKTEDPVDSTGMVKVDHDEKDEGLESANHAKLFQNLKEDDEVEITFSPMETQKEGKESMSRIEMPLRDEDGGEDLARNVEILRSVEDNSKTEAPLSPLETLAKGAEAEAASEPEGLAPEKIDDP